MTTITFNENINGIKLNYNKAIDFLSFFDTETIYEEYLERKMQEAKKSSEDNFVNL